MLNSVCLLGRLTKDPELKTTQSGKSVCSFSLAVDGFKKGETDFIDCVAWNASAENLAKFKKKGEQIAVTGQLKTRTYEDRNGNKRKVVEVRTESVTFVGGKSTGETPKTSYNAPQSRNGTRITAEQFEAAYSMAEDDGESLPF